MLLTSPSLYLTQRYQIFNQLGAGGMGVVYRALDRLSGEVVALKQVTVDSAQLRFVSRTDDSQDVRLALAHEFKTLASLRHPHIVSVLDYGFDAQRQPFFTMTLLEEAQTIVEAGCNQPSNGQYTLLLQLLQALLYLHRRGILHRDLKPANVLVVNGQVKVLDFGLSVAHGEGRGTSGTLAYMAPELLEGSLANESSDLYAFGMITYELFAGKYPFRLDRTDRLIDDIRNCIPDVTALHQNEALTRLIERLLVKNPSSRYSDTGAVLVEFSAATEQQLPTETVLTRESFLQGAQFVGREAELQQLSGALAETLKGRGQLWLVGGESGSGKSRLLDELRTLALVEGTLVLRGQAVSEGGTPYLIWHDTLRQLCLQADLTDLEKSVLKALIPDISTLLDCTVPDAPTLDPEATHDRLTHTISLVFARQTQPIIAILEDVQWAGSESIGLLKQLSLQIGIQPLMLVASYRSDERPDLPNELPDSLLLSLKRLSKDRIADLSSSILGETRGRQTALVDLLADETEGNVFFIIEVLRVLAEESGQLDRIGTTNLPTHIFSGGMNTVIQRRLKRVPAAAESLLQTAAVTGRQIDPMLLGVLEPQTDVDQWLLVCADASVLDFQQNHWRFSHDKLREGVLTNLAKDQQRSLHQRVAEAIEQIYADVPDYASALVNHWAAAGQIDKERHYAAIAGEQALARGAYHEAVAFLKRALTETLQTEFQAGIEYQLGEAFSGLGLFEDSRQHFEQALLLLGDPIPTEQTTLRLGLITELLRQTAHRLLPSFFIGRSRQNRDLLLRLCRTYQKLFAIYAAYLNQIPPAIYSHFHSLNLAEVAGVSPELVQAYAQSAYLASFGGASPLAALYSRRAQKLGRQVGDLPVLLLSNAYLGAYQTSLGHWTEAERIFQRALKLSDEVGEHRHRGEVMDLLTFIRLMQGRFGEAAELALQTTTYANKHSDSHLHIESLTQHVVATIRLDKVAELLPLLETLTLKTNPEIGLEPQIWGYGGLALAHTCQGNLRAAREAADMALKAMKQARPTSFWTLDSCAGIVETYFRLWQDSIDDTEKQLFRHCGEQALRYLNKLARKFPVCRPRTLLWQGLYAACSGGQQAAHDFWRKGLAGATQLHMPYDEGLLHDAIGQHLSSEDRRSVEHLRQATVLFEQLGIKYDAIQTRNRIVEPTKIESSLVAELSHSLELARQQAAQNAALLEQFQQLAQISPLINSSLDQAAVLQEVMDAIIRITHAKRAYLVLVTPEQDDLNIAIARNWEQKTLSEAEIIFSQRIVRLVLESAEPLLTVDALADPRFSRFESVVAHQIRSVVCTPLVLRGKVIGALYADNSQSPDESSLPVLRALAAQAGTAIENARLFEQVEAYASDLRQSREQIVTVREEERRRLRREIHDGLGPLLAGIVLRIEATQMRLLEDAPNLALLETIRSKVQDAFNTMRQSVYDLRPPALDELGLLGAIREYVDNLSGLETTLDVPPTLPSLPAAMEVAAYRIVLEALANVIRHAKAKSCLIRIALDEQGLTLQVQDDGQGLTPDFRAGVGVNAMRERAAELGGVLQITPVKEGGTCILAHLPMRT